MEKKVTTKTENKTVATRAKSKTVETKTECKAVAPKPKKIGFEDALIEYSYSGRYDEMKGYLIKLEVLNVKQFFLVATTDGVIQEVRPIGIKNMNFEIEVAYFRELLEELLDSFLDEVDQRLCDNADFYSKIILRGSSK